MAIAEKSDDAVVEAEAKDEEERFPVSGTFALAYRLNHANFVDTESDQVKFGYQAGVLSAGVSYDLTDKIGFSGGIAVDKELSESFNRPPAGNTGMPSTRMKYSTEVRDISVGAGYENFYTIPVADIVLSAELGGAIPFSRATRAAGVRFILSPGLLAKWSLGDFSTTVGLGYSYYLNRNPTAQVDCDAFPHKCEVSGKVLASPNALHDWSASLKLAYQILEPLGVSASYAFVNGMGAVKFPEADEDEKNGIHVPPGAQTGNQVGLGAHMTRFKVSYAPIESTNIGLAMTTTRGLYREDNKAVTIPIFDFDSDLFHRTSYVLSVSHAL